MAAKAAKLGKRIDRYFELRKKRLGLERQAEMIKVGESLVRDELIVLLNKAEIDSAKGTKGTVSLTRPIQGRADDWTEIFKWIKKTGTFEVLSPRLNQANIKEQLEHDPKLAKKGIPGVKMVTVTKFHATANRGT